MNTDATVFWLACVQGGCIIRAVFLDEIRKAYERNPKLANLMVDPEFAKKLADRDAAWRRVVSTVGSCKLYQLMGPCTLGRVVYIVLRAACEVVHDEHVCIV